MTINACTLAAGELQSVFLPGRGMLGVSLQHRGDELLRRLEHLDVAAAKGSTAGIPLLYPWANRLAAPRYNAAGKDVTLDPASPLLHPDERGLLIHGIKWALLNWDVVETRTDRLVARLDWNRSELLAVFPYRHVVEMTATLLKRTRDLGSEKRANASAATIPMPNTPIIASTVTSRLP